MRSMVTVLLAGLGGCAHAPVFQAMDGRPAHVTASRLACQDSQEVLAVDPAVAGEHPLDYYVKLALSRNPEVQAMQRRVAARLEVIPQVTTLPDPMLSNVFWPIAENSPQTASGRMPYSLMVEQQFPWLGKLRLRGQVAELESQIALAESAETELRIIAAVKEAYYDIGFFEQAIRFTQESEKNLHLYIKSAEKRYALGQVSQQDVLRAHVELKKLEDQLITLRQQFRSAQADLAKLLSVSPETDLRTVKEGQLPAVPQQVEQLYQVALATRPELQGKLQAILRDQQHVELARLEYFPDVAVGVGWDRMTTADALSPVADGKDNIGFKIGVNVPLWQQKRAAGVREARSRKDESISMYAVSRDEAFRQIKRLTVQARALEQQIVLYRKDIIPKAEQTLNVSAVDYTTGKVDIQQVLENWNQLLNFRIQLERLQANLGQILAGLERAVGAQLARDPKQ